MKKSELKLAPVIACIVTMLCVGIVYMWGVFQQYVIDYYGWEKTAVSLISSVNILMFGVGIFLGGILVDRRGPHIVNRVSGVVFFLGLFLTSMLPTGAPWRIYITYGVLAGIGVGLAYAGSTNCLQKWFPTRRGFASALCVCAFGTSIVVCVPIAEALLKIGVPFAFRVLGIVLGGIVIICSLFVKAPPANYMEGKKPAAPTDTDPYTLGEAVRDPRFWYMCSALFFMPATYMIVNPIVKTLAIERGISAGQATLTAMLVGVASAVSRFVLPTLSDKVGRAKSIFAMCLLQLVCSILMIFAGGAFYTVIVFLVVCAYCGPAGIYPAMCGDAYGMKHTGTIFGLSFLCLGLSSLFFTWITGIINRATGAYTWSFIVGAIMCLIPAYCMWIYDRVAKKKDAERLAKRSAGQ